MKTFDQLIEAAADNYEFNEDGKGALMSPHHREGFITGAKFVSENPTMIPAVAELVETLKEISVLNDLGPYEAIRGCNMAKLALKNLKRKKYE